MPTYTYDPNVAPLTQEELDALAAEQLAMGGAVPAGGYVAAPIPDPASEDYAIAQGPHPLYQPAPAPA